MTQHNRSDVPVDVTTAPENPGGSKSLTIGNPWLTWSSVAGSWIIQFCTVGFMSAFGVMQTFYLQGFLESSSASAISWIGSIQLLLDLALAVIGGRMMDRGHVAHVIIAGSLAFIVCLYMLSLAKPHQFYQVFLAQGLGTGLGIGLVYLPTSVIVTQYFDKYKGLAIGIVMSGGSLGGVVFSIALNYLLNSSMSFAAAMRIVSYICTGLLLVGNVLVLVPLSASARSEPLDAEELHPVEKESITTISSGKQAAESIVMSAPSPKSLWARWDIPFICVIAMACLSSLGKWFPMYYVQIYAQQHGIDKELSFYALAIMNFTNMLGRIIGNWLGDRWGPAEVYFGCLIFLGGLQPALLGCSTSYGLVLFTIFYGFFLGISVSLYLPVVQSVSTERDVGMRMGVAFLPVGIACAIGTPICGAIIGDQFVWWKGIVFATLTVIGGAAVISVILPKRCKIRR